MQRCMFTVSGLRTPGATQACLPFWSTCGRRDGSEGPAPWVPQRCVLPCNAAGCVPFARCDAEGPPRLDSFPLWAQHAFAHLCASMLLFLMQWSE
eukprot:678667-Alexandrium_andersonii.AAC.1